jgi:uncharacterized protein YgbK (DUF1537 family)
VTRLLVFADDATGALEAGASLTQAGCPAEVALDCLLPFPDSASVFCVLVPTRHLSPAGANCLMREALSCLDAPSLYLKTDSTLRGPIGACFEALLDARPDHGLVYIPAYPSLGREVKDGILLVEGRPVAETEFASDPLNPVHSSSVLETAARDCRFPFTHVTGAAGLQSVLAAAARPIAVCDAATETQVGELVQACRKASRPLILAGPASPLAHLAPSAGLPLPRLRTPPEDWLLVCGSRHPLSRAQARAAADIGLNVLLAPEEPSSDPAALAAGLAATAAGTGAHAFIVFGGDTALALWRRLGIQTLQPLGEVVRGIPVSRSGPYTFITKAGGFGPTDLAARILNRCIR